MIAASISFLSSFFSSLLARRFEPVRFEDVAQLSRDGGVGDHHTDLAALIELGAPKALTADEGARAVADDRPRVEAQRLQRPHADRVASALELPDHPDIDAGGRLRLQQLDERRILDVDVVDQQLPFGAS